MARKTLKELQEKAEREAKKTQRFQVRKALKSKISTSKRTRRQAKFGGTLRGAREVGKVTVGLSAAAVTLVGQAARRAQAKQRPVSKGKKKVKKRSPKKRTQSRNIFEEVYRRN